MSPKLIAMACNSGTYYCRAGNTDAPPLGWPETTGLTRDVTALVRALYTEARASVDASLLDSALGRVSAAQIDEAEVLLVRIYRLLTATPTTATATTTNSDAKHPSTRTSSAAGVVGQGTVADNEAAGSSQLLNELSAKFFAALPFRKDGTNDATISSVSDVCEYQVLRHSDYVHFC